MVLTFEEVEHTPANLRGSDVVEARFVEFVPNVRVVQEIDFESNDPAFAGPMRMTWSLAPFQPELKLPSPAKNVPDGIAKEDHAMGLRSSLENLAAFVE